MRKIISIHRSHDRNETKTGESREFPIPDELVPFLAEAIATSPSDLVFPKSDGTQRQKSEKLSRALRTAYVKAGLAVKYKYSCRRKGCGHREERQVREELRCPKCNFKLWAAGVGPKVRFYDLRHAAASLHREAGCDPHVVQLMLGHSARSTTDDIYTHLSDEYVRKELNKLSLFLNYQPAGKQSVQMEFLLEGVVSPPGEKERWTGNDPATPSLGSLGMSVHPFSSALSISSTAPFGWDLVFTQTRRSE